MGAGNFRLKDVLGIEISSDVSRKIQMSIGILLGQKCSMYLMIFANKYKKLDDCYHLAKFKPNRFSKVEPNRFSNVLNLSDLRHLKLFKFSK